MIKRVIDLILENRNWVFSGIGVFFLGGISTGIYLFFKNWNDVWALLRKSLFLTNDALFWVIDTIKFIVNCKFPAWAFIFTVALIGGLLKIYNLRKAKKSSEDDDKRIRILKSKVSQVKINLKKTAEEIARLRAEKAKKEKQIREKTLTNKSNECIELEIFITEIIEKYRDAEKEIEENKRKIGKILLFINSIKSMNKGEKKEWLKTKKRELQQHVEDTNKSLELLQMKVTKIWQDAIDKNYYLLMQCGDKETTDEQLEVKNDELEAIKKAEKIKSLSNENIGNIYWLGHDLMWTIPFILRKDVQNIDRGFKQALVHLTI